MMTRHRVTVVGLGPGDGRFLTRDALLAIDSAPQLRFRTTRHPAAAEFGGVTSYDAWYDTAESFDALYDRIVDDLAQLAEVAPVVYVVPGSPLVAESTVERLLRRSDLDVEVRPALSSVDVACGALGIDPMTVGLQVVDALDGVAPLRSSGALLVLQTFSPEVMAAMSDRLEADTTVCVVFHAGLPEEELRWMTARDLGRVHDADHLTSLYVPEVHDAGSAVSELVALMEVLREKCAWDQEQTHTSLARHLLEESYEVIDALEKYGRAVEGDGDLDATAHHVEEELGDLLFQIVFHAHLGREQETFSLRSIAEAVHHKLVERHPHVFGDVTVTSADDAEVRWEKLKKTEKQRDSVTDGIAWELPGFVLLAKLMRKAASVDVTTMEGEAARELVLRTLATLDVSDVTAWRDVVGALGAMAKAGGVDIEGVARSLAVSLRDEILAAEGLSRS